MYVKKNMLTVADASPVTANPKRRGRLSCVFAFRGSQMPQQNQMKMAVAMNSMANACGAGTEGFVTQNAFSLFKTSVGVSVTSKP